MCLKSTKSKNWNKFFYQNVWKTISKFFTLIDFCVSLMFFLNSNKKNGKKVRPKSQKVQHWDNFLCQFWKVQNSFLKNIPEKKYLYFIIIFPFLTFFLVYEHPKGTKHGMKYENPLFFKKRFLCKRCWICCKNSTNVAKKISNNSLVPGLFPKFFFGCYINMF